MRPLYAILTAVSGISFAQLEPYEQRSLFEILIDNPLLLATAVIMLILVIVVIYLLFPMKKKLK